jgi:hypothetical protein
MKRPKFPWLKRDLVVLVIMLALIGWFGVQAVQAQDHGSVMMDSGFKQWNVDTPKEKAFFGNYPQGKIITYQKGNKVCHVYKDPQTGAVYCGDPPALQTYLQKAKAQNMAPAPQENAAQASDPDFWLNWEDEYGP